MRRHTMRVGQTAIVCLGMLMILGADERKQVTFSELSNGVEIVGSLGKPLGTYMKIEGTSPDEPLMMSNPLEVETIDGNKLDKPVLIEVKTNKTFKKGEKYRFRGYESGGMSSTPQDPNDRSGNEPQQPYHFAVWFEVVR